MLAASALADSSEKGDTVASRKRAIKAAVDEVASYLGNTPTIARNSYIDPRVIDRYEAGETIAPTAPTNEPAKSPIRVSGSSVR